MKSNVIRFPSREKEYRDQVLEIKEELVNGGHFEGVLEILCQSFKIFKRGLHNDREIRF